MSVLTKDRSPTMADLLKEVMDFRISQVHTSAPGKILKWDPATQLAEVQVMVQSVTLLDNGTRRVEDFPVLNNVPVLFPRAGSFFMSMPVAVGGFVQVHFQERSIDEYQAGDGSKPLEPQDIRTHALSDAVATPGFFPNAQALADVHADNIVIGKDGGTQAHFKDGEIALGSETPAEFVALATKVLTELSAIKTAFDSHMHTGVSAGVGTSGGPVTPMPAPSSVASTVVKAD